MENAIKKASKAAMFRALIAKLDGPIEDMAEYIDLKLRRKYTDFYNQVELLFHVEITEGQKGGTLQNQRKC